MNRKGIFEEFSGQRAKQLGGEIIRYHRVVASPGMIEAARFVASFGPLKRSNRHYHM